MKQSKESRDTTGLHNDQQREIVGVCVREKERDRAMEEGEIEEH
jgi:hypothetical protein